jgi:hypothetical protein
MKEFPTRTFNLLGSHFIYSGSGYFRIFPYQFVQKKFKASQYEMAYFHPRDFDNNIHHFFNNHPMLQLRYRIGTNNSRLKIEKLVSEFEFITLQKAINHFDWEKAIIFDMENGESI